MCRRKKRCPCREGKQSLDFTACLTVEYEKCEDVHHVRCQTEKGDVGWTLVIYKDIVFLTFEPLNQNPASDNKLFIPDHSTPVKYHEADGRACVRTKKTHCTQPNNFTYT